MKRLMYAAMSLAVLVSCSKDRDLVEVAEQMSGSEAILATAVDFVTAGATKTVITQSGGDAPSFAWKAGDVIGIIPMNGKTVQSNYEIAEIGSNPRNAKFDGGVWALKEGKEYAAYYPFNEKIARSGDNLEFSFLGQTQSANNSLEHLGTYDFMYASAVVPQNGSAQFDFGHKISLVRLQLTVPKADIYTKVVLESSENWFANGASLKLSDGTMTAMETQKSATINLNNIEVAAGNVLTVWFAMLPTGALSGKTLSVVLFGDDNTCTGEINGIDTIVAGSAYSYPCSLSSSQDEEYVDLGLSVKWATCNIGASSPEEYGDYYAWGDTEPLYELGFGWESPQQHWKTGKNAGYIWDNTPYHIGSSSSTGWTKYVGSGNSSYWSGEGSPDNKTVLDPEDDVAYVTLGDKWRMPTESEFNELIDEENCIWIWTSLNGVEGFKVTSKKSGYAGNWIFLPAAGNRDGMNLSNCGIRGSYWFSSLYLGSPISACGIGFGVDFWYVGRSYRYYGRSVRPVYVNATSISLDRTSLNLSLGCVTQLKASVAPSNCVDNTLVWSSSDPSIVALSGAGLVTALSEGSAVITISLESDNNIKTNCTVTVTNDFAVPEMVDLGLPSGLKWASFNLGARNPEEYGCYYQWAGLQAVSDTCVYLDWDNCPYHIGLDPSAGWTKYIPLYKSQYWSGSGSPDNKTTLDLEDDVAHVKLGNKWRMPTYDEFKEMRANCTSEWTTLNGEEGTKFTSKMAGYTDKWIFLPGVGYRNGEDFVKVGSYGSYWTSSLHTDNPYYAGEFHLSSDGVRTGHYSRSLGRSVRPVSE